MLDLETCFKSSSFAYINFQSFCSTAKTADGGVISSQHTQHAHESMHGCVED